MHQTTVLLYWVLVLVLDLYLSTIFGYWYLYLYLLAKYWYLYWYMDNWCWYWYWYLSLMYWYWYWYLLVEYLIQDCQTIQISNKECERTGCSKMETGKLV